MTHEPQAFSAASTHHPTDPTALPLFAQSAPTHAPARKPTPPAVTNPWAHATKVATHTSPDIDWKLVATLRAQASDQLSHAIAGQAVPKSAQEELGRSIVLDLIEQTIAERVSAGKQGLTVPQQETLARATFDALFRLGRLQPLVDDDQVENIIITGHDDVRLELTDGRLVVGPPVADSDAELIDFLVFLASRSEVNARAFSESQPRLHLRLDGGARLAAAAWVTPRPTAVIRRHRLVRVTLDDLVNREMLTPLAASFLAAAVRARRSIVVSGAAGAGKTTLTRALCHVIPEHEAVGTFETEYELHLHELRPLVHAWEARPGTGERGPDGRQAGEFSLDDALIDSFRFNLSRQIVGEVRGREVWPMIKAMESGTGSLSTTHATNAVAAIRKLVTCAMEAGPQVTHALATSKLAAAVDLVVHLDLETTVVDGTSVKRRRVAEIVAVSPGEADTGYATTHVFAPGPDGTAVPQVLPDEYRSLAAHDFDLDAFTGREAS